MTHVEASDWTATLAGLRDDGFRLLDYLTAVDRIDSLELVVHLVDPDTHAHVLLSTRVGSPGGSIDSVTSLFPGADWHEREVAEMFGVEFTGHPSPGPLLLRAAPAAPPLLKSSVLAARVDTPFPGAGS